MALNAAILTNAIKSKLETYKFKVTIPGEPGQPDTVEYRQLYKFDQTLEGETGPFNPADVLISTIIEKTVEHIIANMVIKGIGTTLDDGLLAVFTQGVPVATDGGAALKTAWMGYTTPGTSDLATQNNDGTGHVE